MKFKQTVYGYCLQTIQHKINLLQASLADLRLSAANETKSSAGDKYETAKAMLHIEQENTSRQLAEALAQLGVLQSMDIAAMHNRIAIGSLVKTNQGVLFMAIPLGKISIEHTTVIVLSPHSPLGAKLLGLTAGQSAAINNQVYQVEEIS